MASGNRVAVCAVRLITPGDDLQIPVTLYADGAVFPFTGAIVECAFTDGRGRQFIGSTAQSSGASGASWSTGILVAEFASAQSLAVVRGTVFLEVQVTLAGKKLSWPLIPMEVQQGVIP